MFGKAFPVRDNIAMLDVNIEMVFQITFVHFFLQEIDAPIFAIEEKHNGSGLPRFQAHVQGRLAADIVLNAGIRIKCRKGFDDKMLEAVARAALKKLVFETLFAILFPSINFHCLLWITPSTVAMCT